MEPHRDSATDADMAPPVRDLDPAVRDLDPAAGVRAGGVTASPRASNADRDAAATRLQDAFADGRLDDAEFDERMRAALTAKTHAELDRLLGDLPDRTPGAAAPVAAARTGRDAGRPGRYAIGWKGSVRRAGRWRVPERYTTVVYKGGGVLDLRAAELLSPATTIVAVAYKSEITLLVPPGVRVEMTGFGITQGPWDDMVLAPDAPVLHVRGIAYKGRIETASRPPARPQLA
ncbi:MAG: DUF1707 domain-containing protein [Streptosporangiaceae bacterium]